MSNLPKVQPASFADVTFSGVRNYHGHTTVDHFLQGAMDANKIKLNQIKHYQGRFPCDMCAGDGLIIEVVKQFDRTMSPISSFNQFSKCLKCLGTGRDIEAVRKAAKVAK